MVFFSKFSSKKFYVFLTCIFAVFTICLLIQAEVHPIKTPKVLDKTLNLRESSSSTNNVNFKKPANRTSRQRYFEYFLSERLLLLKLFQFYSNLQSNLRGLPGIDYPIYGEIPLTKFSCDGRFDGT